MRGKILSAIALTPFLFSGEMKQGEEAMCESPFHTMHVGVRHTESNGVGYNQGYTTLEAFGISDWMPSFMPFLDLRGHVFNNGKVAGNVGIGERSVIPSIDHIFGLYVYYDTRQSEHGLKVNQVSPGIELLGSRMEYRINGYFPVKRHSGNRYDYRFNSFSGNQILLQRKRKYAMAGGDGEIGFHLNQSTTNDFYFGVGPYYFKSKAQADWGGKARLNWRYKDYVKFEASYSYDHIFKNIVQGSVSFSYPFGPKLMREGSGCPNPDDLGLSRAAFAPYRFEIPVLHSKKKKEAAINPETDLPWQVWFVNNTSHSEGTFESPFPLLLEAQVSSRANDMIYVFPGDGTPNGQNAGIVLKDGQKLFGAGIDQTVATTVGTFVIPAQASGLPVLTNTTGAGTVVQVANGNEVAGLNIQLGLSGSNLIAGTEVEGGSIHDNTIFGAPINNGISISGSGAFLVQNNNIQNVTAGLLNAGIELIVDGTNAMTATIVDNTVVGYALCVNIGVNDTASGVFEIDNNNLSNAVGAEILVAGSSTNALTAAITNNQVNNGSAGIVVAPTELNACVTIANNTVNGAAIEGILLESADSSNATFKVLNNQVVNIGVMGGGIVIIPQTTTCITNLELAYNNSPQGYNFDNTAAGTINVGPIVNNVGPIFQTGTFNEIGYSLCNGE